MIKYQYAYNLNGQMVHIDSLVRETGNLKDKKYTCISCDNELIPRLGKIKKHHFAHKVIVTCSGETYLHNLGKKMFYQEYKQCIEDKIPFYIELFQKKICNRFEKELNTVCFLEKMAVKHDLTQIFNEISLEKREGTFIPDVMLFSKTTKTKLFIEIAVTHLSTELKLSSNFRIIELKVENEQDLEVIKEHFLSVRNTKLKFKNFKTIEIKDLHCLQQCNKKEHHLFIVSPDGSSRIRRKLLNQIPTYLQQEKDKIAYYTISNTTNDNVHKFKYLVAKAHQDGAKISNCYLCRYHADNDSYDWFDDFEPKQPPIFCKFLKIACYSNDAKECKGYRPDKKYIDKFLEYEKFLIESTDDDYDPDSEYT